MARERMARLARLEDPADIARWELEAERASLASRERVRVIRGKLGNDTSPGFVSGARGLLRV
jgi:hypothetical protein